MGQKVNPIGLRTGINKDWNSKWYASKKDFATFLNRDIKIREYLAKKLKDAAVANVVIERNSKKTEVIIYTAKPGVIIGHGGEEIEGRFLLVEQADVFLIQPALLCRLCQDLLVIVCHVQFFCQLLSYLPAPAAEGAADCDY